MGEIPYVAAEPFILLVADDPRPEVRRTRGGRSTGLGKEGQRTGMIAVC